MIEYKLGKNKTTGKIVVITEAERGLTCDCICPDCGRDFIAAQGDKNEWHFRHDGKTNCKGGQETALHLLAKEIIASNNHICIQSYGKVFYNNAVKEEYFETIKPDVTASTNGQNLFFEVLVTHPIDETKESFYKNGEHKSVEINLQKHIFTTRETLEQEILENCTNKRVIFWEKKIILEKSNNGSCLLYFLFSVIAFFGLKYLWKKIKNSFLF